VQKVWVIPKARTPIACKEVRISGVSWARIQAAVDEITSDFLGGRKLMKKIGIWFIMLSVLGCSQGGTSFQSMMDEPQTILKDPHYASYQQKLEALEHRYLQREITYAEYLEQKKEIDNIYDQEVKKREGIIGGY
jgi:hypothetical protein